MSGRWFWCARTATSHGATTKHPPIPSQLWIMSADRMRPRSTEETTIAEQEGPIDPSVVQGVPNCSRCASGNRGLSPHWSATELMALTNLDAIPTPTVTQRNLFIPGRIGRDLGQQCL